MIRFLFIFAVVSSFVLASATSYSRSSCSEILRRDPKAETNFKVNSDPVEQWLLWEELANGDKFQKPTDAVALNVSLVPLEKVDVWASRDVSNKLKNSFIKKDMARWAKHPFVESRSVAFSDVVSKKSRIKARFSASRSMVISELKVSVKMVTDHPHGPDGFAEPEKLTNSEDIESAVRRDEFMNSVNNTLGDDQSFVILPEVMAIADKATGNGILFRDISALYDGHYYLPALSIPYVGRQIAALNKMPFDLFWQQHYASALGRVKAKLLLRYGLEMETPNPQNFLIQLDANLKPTGVLVVRDFGDSDFVAPVANALGYQAQVKAARKLGENIRSSLKPYGENSFWLFDEAADLSVSSSTLRAWSTAHDQAYVEEIESRLQIKVAKENSPLAKLADYIFANAKSPVEQLSQFVTSPEGLKRLSSSRVSN